jgi:hypothetical protein
MKLMRALRVGMVVCVLAAQSAMAHDTWFEPLGQPGAAGTLLSLGTGNRFPQQEFPIGAEQVSVAACAKPGAPLRLEPLRSNARALLMRAQSAGEGASSCWAQLVAFDIEITPDKVALYLDEIHAGEALRARWSVLQAEGMPWKEHYTKFARIELGSATPTPASLPSGLALDLVFDASSQTLRAGHPQAVRALRDGDPLPGLWLELVDAAGASAGWQRSDEAGRASFTVPRPGRWLLRGVDLRPAPASSWDSRFVTLAFEVR